MRRTGLCPATTFKFPLFLCFHLLQSPNFSPPPSLSSLNVALLVGLFIYGALLLVVVVVDVDGAPFATVPRVADSLPQLFSFHSKARRRRGVLSLLRHVLNHGLLHALNVLIVSDPGRFQPTLYVPCAQHR
ncbi:hypothetical protein CC1G_14210 [Coprinopsis cinerea okayama7|uniref:Uncharacterized protein n=1 Tax=Coprinopsis cinerea (strain Okayama-7 / 130 / ATCC MYA-4618 / FGSC 9003) TaxID=240176 RepID=D6RLN9_COPC7|nr:hypothetical protein CC1G_14210 [Coprinopsis cinerea okayama7\|eukprot:XP_002911677.1 hypothetical protein CC1G_14210 [Coprinopsis cinerea okayama7\